MKCPNITGIANGEAFGSNFTMEREVQFACDTGYNLVGENVVRCTEDGSWSADVPKCDIVTCPTLEIPKHGKLTGTTTNYNAEVTYSCDFGFVLKGQQAETLSGDERVERYAAGVRAGTVWKARSHRTWYS